MGYSHERWPGHTVHLGWAATLLSYHHWGKGKLETWYLDAGDPTWELPHLIWQES